MFATFLLLLGLTLFFILVGRILAGKKGMIIAFLLALAMNGYAYWFSDSLILSAYKAQLAPNDHRLIKVTKGIANDAGIPMPTVYIIPSNSPNAFATGRDPEHAAVAATQGILKILNDDEFRGVMAHEIGHVANRDTLISTVSASVAGGVMLLSRFALFFGGNKKHSWGKRLAIAIVAPVAATLITMAISREREYLADEYSAKITKKPEHLASALLKLEQGVVENPMEAHSPETAHLFIVNPFKDLSLKEIFSTHPPTKKRINRLNMLAGSF
jgi:heat shock protein HtpX